MIHLIKNNFNEYIENNNELKDAFQKLDNLIDLYSINVNIAKIKLLREISKG